jgi:hypothetical protein
MSKKLFFGSKFYKMAQYKSHFTEECKLNFIRAFQV